jgi:hypothetical protein
MELGSGQLRIVNLNERNRDLLTNLGIDQLMQLDAAPASPPAPTQTVLPSNSTGKHEQVETMLEAHEDLVNANPENAAKFKDVLEFLRQDLQISK